MHQRLWIDPKDRVNCLLIWVTMRLATYLQWTLLQSLLLAVTANIRANRGKRPIVKPALIPDPVVIPLSVPATSALTSSQAAIVEERIKQRQYDELLHQIEEDTLAEKEYQRLQTQAKEAQRAQEEALMAKEALSNQLERRRKLKKAETDLEVAKLVCSLLSKDTSLTDPETRASPDTTTSVPSCQLSPLTCMSAVSLPLNFSDASHTDCSRGTEHIKRLAHSSVNT
ncbi:uncharacterized protein LOC125276388 [Megalobrama amblycephala]|uniref:uncharacterized protein LOC125276388 n=1 Tax=Megalobrama amblycephala TaxID=75352 RepID=UPI002013C325|nr:uncharacterized protein LOC125276388 [Megalobrama amblycephala]